MPSNNNTNTVTPSAATKAMHSKLQDQQLAVLNVWLKYGPELLNGSVKPATIEAEVAAIESTTNAAKVGAVGMKLSASKALFAKYGSHAKVGKAIDERNILASRVSYNVRTLADELCADQKKSRKSTKQAKSVGTLKAEMTASAKSLTDAQLEAWITAERARRNG